MHDVTDTDIQQAVAISGLRGYTGRYSELGGGEVNDTFALDCGEKKAILRVSRYPSSWMLRQEADALKLMNFDHVPKLIYFDGNQKIKDRLWIIESFVAGNSVDRLNLNQLSNLGNVLADIHKIVEPKASEINFWRDFLRACKAFGDEHELLNHPDPVLKDLINKSRDYFNSQMNRHLPIRKSLIHGDLSAENMLTNDDNVSIIDWEFATHKDPMADFSTMFYFDTIQNQERWRVKITPEEYAALMGGYQHAGGIVDKNRLAVWMIIDKLGGATYFYWKMHVSGHPISVERLAQYQLDFTNMTESLQREFAKL